MRNSFNMTEKKNFWRMEDPEFYDADDPEVLNSEKRVGEIKRGGMFKHQRDLWNSKSFIKAIVGGYGAGKTNLCAKRAISLSLYNAPSPVMVVSPNYPMARRTIIFTLRQLLDGRRLDYTYNKSSFEFIIKYKGREAIIWIASGDKPDSLKGPNLCAALIDEPFIQDEEVFTQMIARVRDPKARYKEIMLTGTPEQLNWGYDICEGDKADQFNVHVIHAPTYANKAFSDKTVKNMALAYDEKTRAAFEGGQFVNLSKGAVFYSFNKENNIKVMEIGKEEEVFIGMDFNVNPMSFIAFVLRGNHMHFFKEFTLANSDTQEACESILNEFSILDSDGKIIGCRAKTIFPDPACRQRRSSAVASTTDKSILISNGFKVLARLAHPTKRNRWNSANLKFNDSSITIDPSCVHLIKGLRQLSFEQLTKQEHLTHMTDAATYCVEYMFPISQKLTECKTWLL